jgi:DNA-directed RNA polymerase II subunit RPB2
MVLYRGIMLPTEYPSEPDGTIDENIATNAMMTLIHAEMRAEKFAGPQLNSMNSFYETGLPQIATSVFALNGRMRSERNDTGVDAGIIEIEFDVEFRNVTLQPPTVSKYLTGQPELLTPNMAMTNGSTYSVQMSLDAVLHAKAYYKDGHTVERTAEVKNQRIAGIPCMVGSRMCNTYRCSRETLKQLEQDPNDPGGIFICKGGAWSVDNLENLTANMPHCYIQKYEDEAVRMLVLSKPGDAFENSYQTILRLRHSGSLTIDTTMKKNDNTMQIPFYIIFRALGVCSDKEIANHIVYGVDRLDAVGQNMMRVVERAFTYEDPKFAEIRKEMHSATIIDWLSAKMIEVANASAARRDDNVQKYMHAQAMNTFDKYLFPHVGTKPEDRPRKLRYLGHLLNRLISVHLGITDQTDRDSYKSKRVHSAGATIAKTFKTHYNLAFVQVIKKRLMQDFKTTPFSHVPLERVFTHAANTDALENALVQSIVSGEKFTGTRQLKVKNRISSQSVYLKNDMNLKSTLRVVNTPDANMGSKGTDRADVMRRVHPTYVGYIDVSQSADTGVKVGMTKQLAVTASVCGATSSFNLRKVLLSNTDIVPLMDVPLDTIVTEKLSKVFVNGDWIGCCRESHNLVQRYRVARRHGHIHHLVTIVWEPKSREIYFWTDMGRLMRPLVIVYNNMSEYIAAVRAGDKTFKFKQWIKLTAEHLRKLQAREMTMEDLRKERVIEYISPEEQESTYLATSIDDLRKHVNDLHYRYTHCDIPQAILGIVSLGAPMAAMSNTTRNTYFTNHRKQSAGWFALNYPFRIDKNVTLQHYCEQPLVSTFSDAWTYPNGHNAIVALMLHGGKNMEDSIEANQSSIDCGLYNASFYSYEKAELEKGEKMGNPDRARTMDIKKDSVYDSIEDGLVREGTLLTKNTVMISKFATLPQPVGDYRYTDKSVIYKKEEPVRVERSMIVRNESDAQVCKVKFRSDRPLAVGDKLSSRTGNKGICAAKCPRMDMPYALDGLTPDLLVNAHSIPTRMALNQITECMFGMVALLTGTHYDATTFRENDIDGAIALLAKHGIKYGGAKRLYNGRTGCWIDTLIFMGPTTYQRLQKYVEDEHYATRFGPTAALTHQPLDGKAKDGGLRLGEMEAWVLVAHGAGRTILAKTQTDSDGFILPICRVCGQRCIVNEKLSMYKCKTCGDSADIVGVPSTWCANLFTSMAQGMNVKMDFALEPFKYAQAAAKRE